LATGAEGANGINSQAKEPYLNGTLESPLGGTYEAIILFSWVIDRGQLNLVSVFYYFQVLSHAKLKQEGQDMQKTQDAEKGLKKDLGLIPSMALVVGMVIGSGIFMKPGKVIAAAGGSSMGLVAWVLGGIITLAAGLTVAELGAQIPKTGGLYTYLDEVYGKFWGYLFGWVQTIIYGPATVGALGLYFADLLMPFFNLNSSLKMPIAIGVVVFLSVVNSLGSKYGGFIQAAATVGKLIPIALIAIFGILKGNGNILGMPSGVGHAAGMGAAILATLWAYDGWIGVGFVAGEMKNPAKQLPRAIILGLGIVIAAYITVNLGILHVLPAAKVVSLGGLAAGTAAGILFGSIGGKLLSIGILVSIFGTLNGYVLTCPRVPYAMAIRKQLPASGLLGSVNKTFGTPINATIMQALFAIVLMTVGDPDRLTNIAMFIIWVFYVFAFVAVFVLRKKTTAADRPYSVPAYPIIPAIAILGAAYIIISTLMDSPGDSLSALGITAVGIPVYWLIRKMNGTEKEA
jgi:APA family basic amino acid/polyamine antiporter